MKQLPRVVDVITLVFNEMGKTIIMAILDISNAKVPICSVYS